MAEKTEKRKRVVVSIKQKLDALQRLVRGESVRNIASECGVGVTTVKDWKKNRATFEAFCTHIESEKTLSSRSTLKKPASEALDDALWVWFSQQRRRGAPISGPILKQKAIMLNTEMDGDQCFSASDGWLSRWKKRHGIHVAVISGEKLSADQAAAINFREEFSLFAMEKGLTAEQVYNIDETGLNFKMLPERTLASRKEGSVSGYKKAKERITVAACSNAAGTHKLPLFVIGKSAKPRAFKNINVSSLPVYYKPQKSAWMDSALFEEWFFRQFVPSVTKHLKGKNLPIKAVLIMDNAPSHPSENVLKKGEIKTRFLPPNVTSLIQPMDQGVLESLKRRYRRKLLNSILEKLDDANESLLNALKSINMKDVIYMIARSWEELPQSTIIKSWRKLWPEIENIYEREQNSQEEASARVADNSDREEEIIAETVLHDLRQIGGYSDLHIDDVTKWIHEADDELENEFMSDEEIIQTVTQKENENGGEDDDEEDVTEIEQKMSHSDGKAALESALKYIEQQEMATCMDVLLIKKWRDYAADKRLAAKKQTRITDFFTSSV